MAKMRCRTVDIALNFHTLLASIYNCENSETKPGCIPQKLQHTIPEMVNSSPMRTRNGLLYAGKKTDYWVALNPESGDKHASVTTDGIETCTAVAQVCDNS